MGKLDGKVAFVTGSARCQGRAQAIRLAQEGVDIIGVDICEQMASLVYPMSTELDLRATVEHVEALGRRMVGLKRTCVTTKASGRPTRMGCVNWAR